MTVVRRAGRMNPEFLSGEASASPAVEPLLAGARRLDALGHGAGALAARNGLRTTTHAGMPLGMLGLMDFVEVADYDPHLDRLLCIGRREPHARAGAMHLVLRAKKEVGALAFLEVAAPPAGVPQAKRGRTQLENAMGVLEALRGGEACAQGNLLVVAGRTPEETLDRAVRLLGGA